MFARARCIGVGGASLPRRGGVRRRSGGRFREAWSRGGSGGAEFGGKCVERRFFSSPAGSVGSGPGPSTGGRARGPPYEVGDVLEGHRVLRRAEVLERNMVVYELVNESVGSRHVHVDCDDVENAFVVGFRTVPANDKGIPHILEHLVLCGSERYPVRNPFMSMLRRSVSTYMNAWTSADSTSYLYSTTNEKDYYNLMSVYVDAVFFSKLNYLDFLQEGYHVSVDDKGGVEHRGVVYNEMKGAMSDCGSVFLSELYRELYSHSAYRYSSGGDPRCIREVRHDELLDFWRRHYSPGECYVFTYGNLPLAGHLSRLRSELYERVAGRQRASCGGVEVEKRWYAPKKVSTSGPSSHLMESERQQKVAVAWLLHPLEDAYQVFLMSVTCHLMINGPASPMYRALIESGLGTAYSPGSGYDSSPRTASFSIGVSDARDGSAESVESAVFDALAEVAKEGFPPARLESALHQIEYSKKNVTTGFGIELYSSIQHLWMHGVDFCPLLSTANYIARLRRDLDENPRLFQQLVQSYFLDNTHRLTLVVSPDEAYSSRLQLEEAQALAELRKCSSAAGDRETDDPSPSREEAPAKPSLDSTHLPSTQLLDRHRLDMLSLLDRHRLDTRSLLNRQLQHDASMLPKIHFTELDKDPRKPPTILHEQLALPPAGGTSRSIPIQQVYEEPTNGIVYLRCSLDVTHVPSELLMLVPLFSSTLGKMAAGPYDHHQLAELLELVTGEFHVSANVINNHSSLDQYNLRLNIYSSCLKKNLSPMIELWNHVLFAPNFSNLHLLKIILGGITQQLHADLVASGDSYARSLAASSLLPGCYMDEAWTGITQFNYLKSLDDHSSDLLQTSRHLSDISSHVLRASPKIAVNAEHDVYSDIHRHLSNLFQQLPPPVDPLSSSPPPHQALGWRFSPKKRFFELPSQVNYVSQVFKTVPYSHPDFAPLCLLATLLSSNFLHSSIREQGGAYGAHCGHSMGTVQFSSYRDPNVDSTLSAFSQGIQWAHRGDFSNTHLEEAKLQLLASLDSPTPPSRRGIDLFESNISHDMQRTTRHRIFDSTKEDLVRVCSEYLLGHHNASNSSIAVFGCDQTLRSRPDWERAK